MRCFFSLPVQVGYTFCRSGMLADSYHAKSVVDWLVDESVTERNEL